MDELTAVIKARKLIQLVSVSSIPVQIEPFLTALGCEIKIDDGLDPDEPGYCLSRNGKHVIVVNGNDSDERRRFTAFHEMAHIDLNLSSEHVDSPSWSYAKRSANEICCDMYAAELLLPHHFFKPLVDDAEPGMATLDDLAHKFEASLTATASRFVATTGIPCAFVVSEDGKIKYAVRSKSLREACAWITQGIPIPSESLSASLRKGDMRKGPQEVAADIWFNDWRRGGLLLEETRYLSSYDQTLAILWFEDEEVPRDPGANGYNQDEELGLKELDGLLPWPDKHRRR